MRVITWYFRIVKAFTRDGVLDLIKERSELDSLGRMFKPLSPIESWKADAGGVSAEWIDHPEASGNRVVLYLHGGSYTADSIYSHRSL